MTHTSKEVVPSSRGKTKAAMRTSQTTHRIFVKFREARSEHASKIYNPECPISNQGETHLVKHPENIPKLYKDKNLPNHTSIFPKLREAKYERASKNIYNYDCLSNPSEIDCLLS